MTSWSWIQTRQNLSFWDYTFKPDRSCYCHYNVVLPFDSDYPFSSHVLSACRSCLDIRCLLSWQEILWLVTTLTFPVLSLEAFCILFRKELKGLSSNMFVHVATSQYKSTLVPYLSWLYFKSSYTSIHDAPNIWNFDSACIRLAITAGADFTKGLKLSPFIGSVRDLNLRLWS